MLQATEVKMTNGGANRMSADRRKRYADNARRKPRKAGENVIWRRVKDNIDELVIRTGTNPAIASVVSRLVLFGHLTTEEGEVARFYEERMRRYARFMGELPHTVRAQDINAGRGGVDEVERHTANGTLNSYERRAKQAKKQHNRIERVLQPYMHGRDILDDLCLNDAEINPAHFSSVKAMLALLAIEFGLQANAKSKGPKHTPTKGDVRTIANAAVETLASAAKRHKIRICGFDVTGTDRTTRTLHIIGSDPGERLQLKLKVFKMLPETLAAALIKAGEAKGWKAVGR